MDGKRFYVVQVEAMPIKQGHESVQRMVKEMLVVNGVELAVFDHVQGVSKFKNSDAGRFQKVCKAGNKIIDVVDMSKHVLGDQDVRELAFACQLFSASRPKEIVNGWHPNGVCPSNGSVRRIDPEARDTPFYEIAEEIAIIARDLHHETAGAEAIFTNQRFDMFGGMLQQRWRG
jgi:hypothetical protein